MTRRLTRRTDLIVTLALAAVGFALSVVAWVLALFSGMASDTCDVACPRTMHVGWTLAIVAPPAAVLLGSAAVVAMVATRRRAWWVPLAVLGLEAVVWFVGLALVLGSMP